MEFGVLGLDSFQSSENAAETSKNKWGSDRSEGANKLGSGFCVDDWRFSKAAKTDANVSDANMLSFSSCSKSDASTLPYFQQMAPKNTGYYSGALSNSNSMYNSSGVRGPFTPSQWLELEHQALIYKYMTANEPIPAQLLIPIKRALESAALFGFNAGTMRPTPWGWGPFHLGYSNSNDPEPGRCRRTDGKKWRCSRDAMPDQKYCERHMNRGRHRSRKHVEGQANGSTKSITTTTKHTPPPSPALSNTYSASNPSMNPLINRMLDTSQLSFLSLSGSNANLNCRNSQNESDPSNLFTITSSQKNSAYTSGNIGSTHGLNATDGSSMLWPGLQSPLDTTQLSMSIPADYRPSHQNLEMGLGVGSQIHNNNREASWIPSSWEPSMGGPLGEALQSGNGDSKKTSSALNLLPKGWEGMGGYQLSSSSPTGVLQKSALVSLSNSSAGSSPRADNNSKTTETGGSLCNDLQ